MVGAKLCEYIGRQNGLAYRTFIPPNLYGPFDKFDPASSHLLASVIHKIHEAKTQGVGTVEIWGDGSARREFLYVTDLARFIVTAAARIGDLPLYLNVGVGRDFSVLDYYRTVAEVIRFRGDFAFDTNRPKGMHQKLLDSTKAFALGWQPATLLKTGIQETYAYYRQHLT